MHVIDAHSYRSDWLCAQAGPKAYRPKETPDSTMLRTPLEALAGGGSQQRCTLESDRPAGLGRAPERPSGGQSPKDAKRVRRSRLRGRAWPSKSLSPNRRRLPAARPTWARPLRDRPAPWTSWATIGVAMIPATGPADSSGADRPGASEEGRPGRAVGPPGAGCNSVQRTPALL